MASIIQGFNYDIFISYRQKDNKYEGWVTEFVDNLKGELESTFKEEISVYFDINPHDGLLETHDVDASLKEKLKCLVFIPIISRTYCDPKSFAWEHEFKAFIELASKDAYGLKVRLPNGNISSRVLPVRIHDLDDDDIKLCESILGSFLRGVEFIYGTTGVNRPLTPYDNPEKNLYKTIYRDQINKIALAIKEIIKGLSSEPEKLMKEKDQPKKLSNEVSKEERKTGLVKPAKVYKWKLLSAVATAVILIIAIILTYPKIFKINILERQRSSGEKTVVAIIPFQNATNDTLWDVWQAGIQNELITYLTNSEELKVRQKETVNGLLQSSKITNYASIAPSIATMLSKKLEASILISGSINQAGNIIRVNTQIIDSKTSDIIKSFQIKSPAKEELIFNIIDSLSVQIKNFLIITKLKQESSIKNLSTTNSPAAYRCLVYGNDAFFKKMDYPTAIKLYLQALAIDSNLYSAITMLSTTYYNRRQFDDAKKWCLKVYEKRDQLPLRQNIHISWLYAMLFETPMEEIKYLNQLLQIDDQNPYVYYELGRIYVALDQYDKAISAMRKTLEIYKKWESKPRWVQDYIMLGYALQKTNEYRKENRLFKKAAKDFPDDPELIYRQAVLALIQGKTKDVNNFIEKYMSIRKILSLLRQI